TSKIFKETTIAPNKISNDVVSKTTLPGRLSHTSKTVLNAQTIKTMSQSAGCKLLLSQISHQIRIPLEGELLSILICKAHRIWVRPQTLQAPEPAMILKKPISLLRIVLLPMRQVKAITAQQQQQVAAIKIMVNSRQMNGIQFVILIKQDTSLIAFAKLIA